MPRGPGSRRRQTKSVPTGRETALGAVFAGLAAVFLALPGLTGGPLCYRDLSQNLLPVRTLTATLRAAGATTGWNPFLAGGTPLLANPNSLLLHPGWQFDRLMEPAAAIKLSVLLHTLLAGVFLALFVRRRGGSPSASVLAGVVASLSGPALSLGTLPNLLTAWAWVPPAMYFLDRVRCGLAWSLPAAVVAGGMSLMPADPASALALLGGAAIALTGGEVRRGLRPRLLLLFTALAAGAAMVQLLPAWGFISRSARTAGFAAGEVGKWSLHPARLPELAVPGFLGNPSFLGLQDYWGPPWLETGLPFLLSIYLSAAVLVLALAGLSAPASHRGERLAAGVLGGLSLLLAFGRHLPGFEAVVGAVPALAWVRYPEKLLIPALLAIALLAARGLDALLADAAQVPRRRTMLAAGGLLLFAALAAMLAGLPASPSGSRLVPEAAAALAASWRQAAGFAATAGLLLVASLRPGAPRAVLRLGLLLLVAADLSLGAIGAPSGLEAGTGKTPWEMRLNPTAPADLAASPPLPLAAGGAQGAHSSLASVALESRTVRFPRPDGFAFRSQNDSIACGFLWDRLSCARSWPSAFMLPTVFDLPTDRLVSAEAARAADAERQAEPGARARLWAVAAAGWVTSFGPAAFPGLTQVGEDTRACRPPLVRSRNEGALPPVRVVGAHALAASAPDALRDTLVGPWPAADLAVVEDPDGLLGASRLSGEHGTAELLPSLPDDLRISVESPGTALLVVSQSWDPGWSATASGRPVPVLRAYGFLTAVPIPAGRSVVELRYRTPGLPAGAAASAAAILLALAGAAALRRLFASGGAAP